MKCNAVQYSDQMACDCGNVWDMHDPYPPECRAMPDPPAALHHTEPLCTGTIIGSTDLHCKERHSCQRYVEWQKWLNQYEPSRGITAFAAQPGCNKKIEVKQ